MIEKLLNKLNKVKTTGSGNWLACCPAHNDKNPSMTVAHLHDGRILIHCFTGCSTEDILEAIGLEFKDLFPERLTDHGKPIRRPFPAADVLEAVSNETMIVAITADRLFNNKDITAGDWARLRLASTRILAARDLAIG